MYGYDTYVHIIIFTGSLEDSEKKKRAKIEGPCGTITQIKHTHKGKIDTMEIASFADGLKEEGVRIDSACGAIFLHQTYNTYNTYDTPNT
jgi:hypothetical protein